MRVLAIYKSHSGCDYHRLRLPFTYEPGCVDNSAYAALPKDDILPHITVSELIVWNRICAVRPEIMEREQRLHGFKSAVDIDDHWELYYSHPLRRKYDRMNIPEILKYNMRFADAVTVSTPRLLKEVRKINPVVRHIPNCIPDKGQFIRRLWPNRPTFIYVAGSSHLADIQELRNPMKRIAGEKWFSDNADFILAGYEPGPVWKAMEITFSADGKLKSYSRCPGLPLENYMDHYEAATCALIPLQDNTFNQYKSNLKILEAAAKRMPAICSFVPPYSDDADAPVLWVKSRSDWYRHIKWVIKNPEAARKMGEELHQWAAHKYNFNRINEERFDFYKSVIDLPF